MRKTSSMNRGGQLLLSNNDTDTETVFDLLKKGESEIILSDSYKDVVLVLGNTGSGKSTLTQWIAGDNDTLIAKEVGEGTGEYIIEDTRGRIGNSTIQSKTVFPELVVDSKTNTAYYDCPGFSDTRSTKIDIATTYFIKKVLDHANSVKMIFVLNHSSVRKGVDRQDFLTLLRHITELIKDVEKFKSSLAIVTTKVDNQYIKQGGQFILVPDNKVIDAIANFLVEVQQDLQERTKLKNISAKDRNFYENSIKFIDALLMKREGNYRKIGIFRRPDEAGPLSKITILQEGKKHIELMINNETSFTVKSKDDFGYTISEKSKNDITDLIEEINTSIWSEISIITDTVQENYQDLLDQIFNKTKSFVTSSIVDVEQSEAVTFSQKLDVGYNVILSLVEDLKNLTNPEQLSDKINTTISTMGINVFEDKISNIAYQSKYFNFLALVSDKQFKTKPWEQLFENTLQFLFKSKKNVQISVEDISLNVNRYLNDTTKKIRDCYYKTMKSQELQKLPPELSIARDVALNISEKIESAKNIDDMQETMRIIREWSDNRGININSTSVAITVNQQKYYNYLQALSYNDLVSPLLTWISPFQDAVKYLDKSEKWYKFLNSLYLKFSEYVIQKDITKYNTANIEDWGKADKPQGIEITKNNFDIFLNKTIEYNLEEYDNVKNSVVTDLQLEELNHVLHLTLKHDMQISCDEPYVFIKGSFIKSSDISEIINNMKWNDTCKGSLINTEIEFINIFSLNTVFIDHDLLFTGLELPVTMVSPKWEIIGPKDIQLNGYDGETYNQTTRPSNPEWGPYFARDGEHGNPGRPAGPGGTFFGIGYSFENGKQLTITAGGGKGGSGQYGQDGQNGKDGSNPRVPLRRDVSCASDLCQNQLLNYGYKCEKNYYTDKPIYPRFDDFYLICEYTLTGASGTNGGKGGNGGKRGKGGKSGNITFIDLKNISGIHVNASAGEDGIGGAGGKGGIGGKNGDEIVIYYKSFDETWGINKSEWTVEKRTDKNRAPSGNNGTQGSNGEDVEPKKGKDIAEHFIIINQYKSYARENLNDRFNSYILSNFLEQLTTNNNVKIFYNTLGFIDELQSLEQQVRALDKEINIVPFYQSILNRISEYAQNSDEVKNSSEHKKVLSYLYTTILSKIFNLEDNMEADLIEDIHEYFKLVKEDIDTLKDWKNSKNKADIINKYKEEYKKGIDIKINEAKSVTKEIVDEIDNVNAEMKNDIEILINEVIDLEKQAKIDQKKLIEKKENLKYSLKLHGLFSCFKFFGQVLEFLGPYGEIAGSIIEGGSSIAESLMLDDQGDQYKPFNIPESVLSEIKMQEDRLKNMKNEKIASLNEILGDMLEEFDKYPEKIGDLTIKLSSIKYKLNKLDKNKLDFEEVTIIENDLRVVLQTKENELAETQKTSKDKKIEKTLKIVNKYVKATFQIGAGLANIYNQYKNNEAQLKAINDDIDYTEFQFKSLKRYEEYIYNTLVPMIQHITSDVDDIKTKIEAKSKVALDVTKWKIQSILGETKSQIQQSTKDFPVSANLTYCIEKQANAMSILIEVYDHIQDYQRYQNVANYMADISSARASSINIINEKLRDAVNYLDITISSNIILQKYQTATEALKQFVFPFAHDYFKDLLLPSQLQFEGSRNETDLDNLVYQVSVQMYKLNSKIDYYRTVVEKKKGYIGTGEFRSKYQSTKPFFTWKNEQHKNTLFKLLSGEEVIVNADIREPMPLEEAIKFNVIDHYFKAKNETLQTELNNALNNFQIFATHLGDSHYRYGNKIYLITTNSQLIWYNLEKMPGTEEPLKKSDSYNSIRQGDLMLSPYATWKLQLFNLNNVFGFKDLIKFSDKLDLEMGGNGSFVNKVAMRGVDLLVDRYYTAIETYEESDLKMLHRKSNENTLSREEKKVQNKYKKKMSTKVMENANSIEYYGYMDKKNDVYKMNGYVINAAPSSHISHINNACNWIKEGSFLFLSNMMIPFNTLSSVFGITISGNSDESYYDIFKSALGKKLGWDVEIHRDSQETMVKTMLDKDDLDETNLDTYYDAYESIQELSESKTEEKMKSEKTESKLSYFRSLLAKKLGWDVEIYRDLQESITDETTVEEDDLEETNVDKYYDAYESIQELAESRTEEKMKSEKTEKLDFRCAEQVKAENGNYKIFTEYTSTCDNCNIYPPLYLPYDKSETIPAIQNLEKYGTLMLADVIARSITGIKHKQLLYLSPTQQKMVQILDVERKLVKGMEKMDSIYGN